MFGVDDILSVALAFFIVTVSPGPANIAVATVAMSSGRRNGLVFGIGLSFGLAFWGLVAATGMGALLQTTEYVLVALKLFGGCYLLWLAYQSGRSALKKDQADGNTSIDGRWFARGLVLNLSNPKAVVAWMAALSMGLGSSDGVHEVAIATLICMILGFLNYTGYALVFSISGVMAGYRRLRRGVDGVVSGLFAIAGFGLIKSALTR